MSGLFGRIFSNVRGFYNEINSATLTGAIDVVITEQEDGTYACSPFHVRFGKMGVIRAREKLVDIEINGIPADIQMKLGEAGEAFFVQKVDEEIPAHLATSPIPSSLELMEKGIKEMKEASGTTTSTPTVTMTTSTSQGETTFVSMDQSNDDFKSAMSILLKDVKSDSSLDEHKEEEKQKPQRKKVLKKKKVGGKSSPRVMSASVPEGDGIFDMEVSETSSEEGELVKMSKSMSFPVIEYDADTTTMGWRKTSFVHPLSDPELSPICSPQATRPPSPVSDSEIDRQRVEQAQQSILLEDAATWEWGDFPKPPSSEMLSTLADKSEINKDDKDKNKSGKLFRLWKRESSMKQQEADGVYLDDLQLEDPEIAKLYLGSPRGFMSIRDRDDDCESGRGASLPQSPHSVDGAVGGPVSFLESEVRHLGHVSLSLCGGLSDPDGVNLEKFMQKVVTFGDLCEKPNMINDPDLVVRIHDKGYFNWPVAAPLLLCNVVFHKDLPENSVKMLTKEHMPKKKKSGGSSWFPWRRTIPADTTQEVTSTMATLTTVQSSIESENFNKTTDSGLNINTSASGTSSAPTSVHSTPRKEQKPKEESSLSPSEIDSEGSEEIGMSQSSSTKIPELPPLNLDTIHRGESPPDVCKKSLRLTTEQIRKLNLRPGVNEITFSVTTQYQGTTRCTSHVYLWRYDDKIVISDIDGTITKSDVLGQILPILGQDWTQCGITDLFTRIHRNGYKFIYLSARAIGQSKITKDLLKNIRQGELVLPDGPLLLNPASLISAFHREVIVKNPEEFKISCLKDVAALFPLSPFYAGFGNKINDVVAYRALKIPSFRIFTINHRGELTHDLSYKFRSSYTNLSQITDHFFPPLHLRQHTNEFSSVNYWRQPIPEIDCLEGEEVLKIENETK